MAVWEAFQSIWCFFSLSSPMVAFESSNISRAYFGLWGIENLARATENYLIYDLVKILTAFMHYYYMGHVKVHKKEIRQNFVADETGTDEPDNRWGQWIGCAF